ncbi:quinone oxidoreductase family protein [Actinoplanes sp. CA-030573]|uniref:quinone oxidoreductase family protein n=1 Tax=Actinoplanes sp. CA-030573 TaxID=3239898 RepID=UPI003D915B6E
MRVLLVVDYTPVRATVITSFGPPDVLVSAEVEEPTAPPGHELVDVTLAGVNYADIYRRRGEYEVPALPAVLGADIVGLRRRDGRRVAALLRSGGGYAQTAAAPSNHIVEVPDNVTDEQALAVLEQGLTAWHSLHSLGRIVSEDVVVITAAAGGVGHLAVQLARDAGAQVIALASTADKRAFARKIGADAVADSAIPDLSNAVRQALGTEPTLILDSVGGSSFEQLHAALAPFGRIVAYGGASDISNTVSVDDLMEASTGVLGFWLQRVLDDPRRYRDTASRLFELVADGRLRPHVGRHYPLADAAAAHADLECRRSIGKLLLDVPQAL